MDLVKKLAAFFKKPQEETKNNPPEGYCPNCWGTQDYEQQIRKLFADKQIEVNNKEANYAFIQKFVVTHLDGIKLKKGNNSLDCPTCQKLSN